MEIYDFEVECADGVRESLEKYRGRVLLIVNTAGRCGFTPQYRGLEELYRRYHPRGLDVLAFPCNQFLWQEPGGNEEIQSFCSLNYGVTFPVYAKIKVNGREAHPLYQWLKKERAGFVGSAVKWNFTKFLIDRRGCVAARRGPAVSPEALAPEIERLLGRESPENKWPEKGGRRGSP